ncbi:MAG: hypothetical protein RSC93_06035 [Erysipelotrichaceae bacterium]
MNEWPIKKCPYCGSEELSLGMQIGQGSMAANKMGFSNSRIEHLICHKCGMILGSRVEKPNLFKIEAK